MAVPTFTPNLHLTKLPANYRVWSQIMNDNLTMMDAAISGFITFNNLRGGWANSTAYALSDTVVDTSTAVIYSCLVAHTSATIPTTFAQDRIAHPTYWSVAAAAASARGAWATATAYNRNDFVLADGTKYAFCLVAHTSGANFATDLALGRWSVLIDLSTVGSLVLPVLSGAGDANKLVMTSAGGTSYVINTISFLLSLFTTTGSGSTIVLSDSPTLTNNPLVPTQAAETNNTRVASTAYADAAVRAIVVRRQTFSVTGTYTPNSKMVYCDIECWGGGGGGAGTAITVASLQVQAASGGAGGYSRKLASKAAIGASQAVTIGAAGTAGAAGNNAGGAGGTTSVGVLAIANGGGGAISPAVGITGGNGATAGTGDIAAPGMGGGASVVMQSTGGGNFTLNLGGGSTLVGAGGCTSQQTAAGVAGQGFGSGGSGGSSSNGSPAQGGGAGAGGYVVITEICWG